MFTTEEVLTALVKKLYKEYDIKELTLTDEELNQYIADYSAIEVHRDNTNAIQTFRIVEIKL